MRILWVVNILFPYVSRWLGKPAEVVGGWMTALAADLKDCAGIELAVAAIFEGRTIRKLTEDNILYYLVPGGRGAQLRYWPGLERVWPKVVDDYRPDLVHIFGTEYAHGLALINSCPAIPAVVSIQGMLSVYERNYYAGLTPADLLRFRTFRDFVRVDGMIEQKIKMSRRARYEIALLSKVRHVMGRTTWDHANVMSINPSINYHYCSESLRDAFYGTAWDIAGVEPHSLFISQTHYPLKGFHHLLETAAMLKREYPDLRLYVAGPDIADCSTLNKRIRLSGYGAYVRRKIRELALDGRVVFTGYLDAEGMADRLRRAHVFVLPSAIENSPNSLAEAMLVGTPCVASYVGGVPDMVRHGETGFLAPFNEPALLAYYIKQVFASNELAMQLSSAAREEAAKRHERSGIVHNTLGIYRDIIEAESGGREEVRA